MPGVTGNLLLTLQLLSTLAMTGLIWFVQLVHYPLMAAVGPMQFIDYERAHCRRITWIVAPLMLIELATATLWAAMPSQQGNRTAAWLGLALVGILWLSTAVIQVPLHRRLEHGFSQAAHAQLVRTNWIRTIAWTLRAGLLLLFGLPVR